MFQLKGGFSGLVFIGAAPCGGCFKTYSGGNWGGNDKYVEIGLTQLLTYRLPYLLNGKC